MASKKIKDLAVKTGSYTDRNGQTKGTWENIGAMFKSDDGSVFLTMKRTFNPAGISVEPGKDSILVSVFDIKPDGQQAAAPAPQQQAAVQDDDIPF